MIRIATDEPEPETLTDRERALVRLVARLLRADQWREDLESLRAPGDSISNDPALDHTPKRSTDR